jgi:hypothetical protein
LRGPESTQDACQKCARTSGPPGAITLETVVIPRSSLRYWSQWLFSGVAELLIPDRGGCFGWGVDKSSGVSCHSTTPTSCAKIVSLAVWATFFSSGGTSLPGGNRLLSCLRESGSGLVGIRTAVCDALTWRAMAGRVQASSTPQPAPGSISSMRCYVRGASERATCQRRFSQIDFGHPQPPPAAAVAAMQL